MKWVLVLIMLDGVDPIILQGGVYDSMIDCFTAREVVMDDTYRNGPAQAVCVPTDAE